MHAFDLLARAAFALAGAALMLLALGLVGVAGFQVAGTRWPPDAETGRALLDGVGYTIIAIAVFDVGKYLIEEEAIRGREMRQAGEARQSMTKFITTIAIAIFLESLVTVFDAGKRDPAMMLYPTFLLLAGVALVVGLGVYQRLSAKVEIAAEESPTRRPMPRRPAPGLAARPRAASLWPRSKPAVTSCHASCSRPLPR